MTNPNSYEQNYRYFGMDIARDDEVRESIARQCMTQDEIADQLSAQVLAFNMLYGDPDGFSDEQKNAWQIVREYGDLDTFRQLPDQASTAALLRELEADMDQDFTPEAE